MVQWANRGDHVDMSSIAAGQQADAPAGRARRGVAWWAKRLGLDTVYLVLGLPMGILTFTVMVSAWATSLSLLITLIGLPLAVATAYMSRGLAWVERRRAALVTGAPVPERYKAWGSGGVMARLKAIFSDPQQWKDLGWHLLLLPLGIAGFTIAVSCWGVTLGLISMPAWWQQVSNPPVDLGFMHVDSWGKAALAAALGIASIPLTIALVRGSAAGTGALASAILGHRTAELEERVEVLTTTRAGAVDAQAAELERIERDLHDGAQARLVAVAMDLGLAEQKLEADPDAARELLSGARDTAKQAIAELRDLARGIRPGLLTERGLAEAVSSFAARSPVPAGVEVDLPPQRLPPNVESAAYFVVAEALTNVAKHAGATKATVSLTARDGRLEVVVTDDGRGSADARGGGLTGLRRRVEALDGTLSISSPPGGPTSLRAEMPCAS
jgi:signal transduction histidine kinase